MGYTHYFTLKETIPQETWDEYVADCKYLSKHLPEQTDTAGGVYKNRILRLNGCFAYKNPIFNKKKIHFNGGSGSKRVKVGKSWEDSFKDDLGHETFCLSRTNKEFNFCKTARKPYDLMVTACLILAKHYFKDKIEIGSDGDLKDWQAGFEFIMNTLPGGITIVVEMKLDGGLFKQIA